MSEPATTERMASAGRSWWATRLRMGCLPRRRHRALAQPGADTGHPSEL